MRMRLFSHWSASLDRHVVHLINHYARNDGKCRCELLSRRKSDDRKNCMPCSRSTDYRIRDAISLDDVASILEKDVRDAFEVNWGDHPPEYAKFFKRYVLAVAGGCRTLHAYDTAMQLVDTGTALRDIFAWPDGRWPQPMPEKNQGRSMRCSWYKGKTFHPSFSLSKPFVVPFIVSMLFVFMNLIEQAEKSILFIERIISDKFNLRDIF